GRRDEWDWSIERWQTSYESSPPARIFVIRPRDDADLSVFVTRSIRPELAWVEKVKLLELTMRQQNEEVSISCSGNYSSRLCDWDCRIWRMPFFQSMLNDISLSPYTNVVKKVLRYVRSRIETQIYYPNEEADFLSHLLRQTGRHLAAFDLVRFHHRGANYPDALLVEE